MRVSLFVLKVKCHERWYCTSLQEGKSIEWALVYELNLHADIGVTSKDFHIIIEVP